MFYEWLDSRAEKYIAFTGSLVHYRRSLVKLTIEN
jgi:hypothetical protein